MRLRRLAVIACMAIGVIGTGIGGGSSAAADTRPSNAPYRCFFVTDGQGHVIYTLCVPWPI